jgi:hypothetical protein
VYVWDNVSTEDFKNFMFFDRFDMLILKISFKKLKNIYIILMHFQVKITLKNNQYLCIPLKKSSFN